MPQFVIPSHLVAWKSFPSVRFQESTFPTQSTRKLSQQHYFKLPFSSNSSNSSNSFNIYPPTHGHEVREGEREKVGGGS